MTSQLLNITSIGEAANLVLNTPSASEKAILALEVSKLWLAGQLRFEFTTPPPDTPARPEKPDLISPMDVPKRRISHDITGRASTLHALLHIELNAIDLAFDIVSRFGAQMPREFSDNWIEVGADEGRHFNLLAERLNTWGMAYGDLPAHNGLWEAALKTKENLAARLAIVPMVLEARGLDVTPKMIDNFTKVDDIESANILKIIYQEEISHVGFGVKWFEHLCKENNKKPNDYFNLLVEQFFNGQLKPPFNHEARALAKMKVEYYQP